MITETGRRSCLKLKVFVRPPSKCNWLQTTHVWFCRRHLVWKLPCLPMQHTLMDINGRWLLLCAFLWLAGGSGCWITTNTIGLRYLFHFFCFCRWLRENHRRSWPRFCRWQSRKCIRTKRSVWLDITFSLCALLPLITLCMCTLIWVSPAAFLTLQTTKTVLFMHEVHIVLIMHSLVIAEGCLSTSPHSVHKQLSDEKLAMWPFSEPKASVSQCLSWLPAEMHGLYLHTVSIYACTSTAGRIKIQSLDMHDGFVPN